MNVTTWFRKKMNLEPQQKGYYYEVKICAKQNRYCKMDPKYALSIFWDFLGHARQPYIYCKMSMVECHFILTSEATLKERGDIVGVPSCCL